MPCGPTVISLCVSYSVGSESTVHSGAMCKCVNLCHDGWSILVNGKKKAFPAQPEPLPKRYHDLTFPQFLDSGVGLL